MTNQQQHRRAPLVPGLSLSFSRFGSSDNLLQARKAFNEVYDRKKELKEAKEELEAEEMQLKEVVRRQEAAYKKLDDELFKLTVEKERFYNSRVLVHTSAESPKEKQISNIFCELEVLL